MTKTLKIKPPFKNGNRLSISRWIIEHFPGNYQEMNYCEPFCHGASVLLNKEKSTEEMIADTDPGVVAIFKSLRDEPEEFISRLKKISYCESSFSRAIKRSKEPFGDYLDHAVNEYVMIMMSRAGHKKHYIESNDWAASVEHLHVVAERVRTTIILKADFREITKVWDDENTFFYLDPPAVVSTDEEEPMHADYHMALLNFVKNARSKIIISGKPAPLYNRHLGTWKCIKDKKKEYGLCLWVNY